MAAGAAQQKNPCEEKKDGGNPKVVEVSIRPAQPEMQDEINERRMVMLAGTGKGKGQRRAYRMGCGVQDFGLVINERDRVVGGNQPDTQQEQRDHLLRNFVRFAWAGRHD